MAWMFRIGKLIDRDKRCFESKNQEQWALSLTKVLLGLIKMVIDIYLSILSIITDLLHLQ